MTDTGVSERYDQKVKPQELMQGQKVLLLLSISETKLLIKW